MQTLYKLTDEHGYTRRGEDNQCLWGEGVSHSGTGKGGLCSSGVIHAYTHPLLAVFLNPIHAGFSEPRLWEAEGVVKFSDNYLKVGCVTLRTIREITLPVVTTEQRVKFAILCAKKVCKSKEWNSWADRWLSGEDRTASAAWAARAAEAARSAWAAAEAARAAAEAARAAEAERAAEAAWAAWAAARAAEAAWAARAARAAEASLPLDLIALAEEAVS